MTRRIRRLLLVLGIAGIALTQLGCDYGDWGSVWSVYDWPYGGWYF